MREVPLPISPQPELPASSVANSAMQLRVINAKLFGMWKPKACGQQKINWIAKEKSTGNSPDCMIQLHIYLIKIQHFLIKTQPLQNFLLGKIWGATSSAPCSDHSGVPGPAGVPLPSGGALPGVPLPEVPALGGARAAGEAAHCPLMLLSGSGVAVVLRFCLGERQSRCPLLALAFCLSLGFGETRLSHELQLC